MEKVAIKNKIIKLLDMAQMKLDYDRYFLEEHKSLIKNFKTVFLFGGGTDGLLAYDYLSDVIGNKEVYYIDNDKGKHGKELYKGIYCYGREKMYGCNPESTIVLITTSKYSNAIYLELVGSVPYGIFTEYQASDKLGNTYIDKEFINTFFEMRLFQYYLSNKDALFELFDSLCDVESCNVLYTRLNRLILLKSLYHRDIMTLPQYFPSEILSRLSNDEVFLDCGAYIGDTIEEFRKQTGDKFKAIYAFEIDMDNYTNMRKNPQVKDKRIVLFNAGVSNRNCTVTYYHDEKLGSSYTLKNGFDWPESKAELKSVDSMIDDSMINEKVTFVKLDVEGAELDALNGMQKMIKRERPKLAVCIYHKPTDMIKLPKYIKELVPQYKFLLRQHGGFNTESVLYAFIE